MEEKDILQILEKIKSLSPFAKLLINTKYSGLINNLKDLQNDKLKKIYEDDFFKEALNELDSFFKKSKTNFTEENKEEKEIKKDEYFVKTSDDPTIVFSDINSDNVYTVTVELPGFNKTNTKMTLINDMVEIRCNKENKNVTKKFFINDNDEIVTANMSDGVLTFFIKTKVLKYYKEIVID